MSDKDSGICHAAYLVKVGRAVARAITRDISISFRSAKTISRKMPAAEISRFKSCETIPFKNPFLVTLSSFSTASLLSR